MVNRRKPMSTRQSKRMSRDLQRSTIGSHVVRPAGSTHRSASSSGRSPKAGAQGRNSAFAPTASSAQSLSSSRNRSQQRQYAEAVQHRTRTRRIIVGVIVALVIVALALGAGFLAFRGTVGSEMALRDSDASKALVQVRSDEPYYTLVTAELGAVAEPLEHAGPDMLLLVRVDRANKSLAIVDIPAGLQVSTDGGARRIADIALKGDAALIEAVAGFAKIDISHFVKIAEGGVEGITDVLGGIEMNIDQVIDDPHAGDVYIPVGTYTLNGPSALTFLRADNLKLGVMDQLQHQADFAAQLMMKALAGEGSFATRVESIDAYFQTDMTLGDIEAVSAMLSGSDSGGISRTVLPGYLTEVTGVVDTGDALFIASADDMAAIIASLEAGQVPNVVHSSDVQPADPASFTVEIQNGTNIAGAAGVTGEKLAAAGFNVAKVGNAEQPIYDETLIVYKGDVGLSRARAVIDALGVGRAVSGDIYYTFDTDVLVIVGSDYKPFV